MSDEWGWRDERDVELGSLVGRTFTAIEGATKGSDEIWFTVDDGRRLRMYHSQDCCESVSVEDVAGDVADIIGSPLTMAEAVSSETPPEHIQTARVAEKAETEANGRYYYEPDSETWTFYKFATVKGYVTLRWLGESNGYYSEGVDFVEPRPTQVVQP